MAPSPKAHDELKNLLATYLSLDKSAIEGGPHAADLRRLHPKLLADSIQELIAGTGSAESNSRMALTKIYNRKTKELAAIYPLLFAVENALRARLTHEFYNRFGIDRWWDPIYSAVRGGFPASSVKKINNVPVSSFLARDIGSAIFYIDGDAFKNNKVCAMLCGSEFLSECTFGHLRYFIANSWSEFGKIFGGRKGEVLAITKQNFISITKLIIESRNSIYHHNPISNRQGCAFACELLCDHLDYHMGSFDEGLKSISYSRPNFAIKVFPRHNVEIDLGQGELEQSSALSETASITQA